MIKCHQSPSVWVERVETDKCCLCADDGKQRNATHQVRITHYFSYFGLVAKGTYCEKHAEEMADVFKNRYVS